MPVGFIFYNLCIIFWQVCAIVWSEHPWSFGYADSGFDAQTRGPRYSTAGWETTCSSQRLSVNHSFFTSWSPCSQMPLRCMDSSDINFSIFSLKRPKTSMLDNSVITVCVREIVNVERKFWNKPFFCWMKLCLNKLGNCCLVVLVSFSSNSSIVYSNFWLFMKPSLMVLYILPKV